MLRVVLLRDEVCPSCDEVRRELDSLREQFPELHVRERLLREEPYLTERLGVVAAPAVVVNDQLAFQGHPPREALWTYLRNTLAGRHDAPDTFPPADEAETGRVAL